VEQIFAKLEATVSTRSFQYYYCVLAKGYKIEKSLPSGQQAASSAPKTRAVPPLWQ
jgi:hypothetical protein